MKRPHTVPLAEGTTFRQEETLFINALGLPAAARARFLATACFHNSTLRDRVVALLKAHDRAEGFLDSLEVVCWPRRRLKKRTREH